MTRPEAQARTVVLAQALESADPHGALLGLAERQAATLATLKRVKRVQNAAQPLADAQRLALRARHLVDALALKHPALAALARPPVLWSWVAMVLPVLALLAGVFTDRITNPHRVDLLSVPLLIVIAFNLLMYGLLALLAVRQHATTESSLIPALLQKIDTWRSRQRGTGAAVVTAFYRLWHALAGRLIVYRCKTVLHLSAAAWAAGIALSLAGRGLVVEYRVGWESTFLGAAQVYGLLEAIFWLPATVFHLTPFTLEQVAALRDFEGRGVAGDRWVWMYVGLLVLVVVAPRLLLAAWAAGTARKISRRLVVGLNSPYFQCLLADMRCTHLTVGLVLTGPRSQAQFLRLARGVADDPLAQRLGLSTPEGDLLEWLEAPGSGPSVDAVLCIGAVAVSPGAVPSAWAGRPLVSVSEHQLATVWDQWPFLMQALAVGLHAEAGPGWARLSDMQGQRQQQRFEESMAMLAAYLRKAAVQLNGETPGKGMAQAQDDLFLSLQQLHRLDRTTGRALEQKLVLRYACPASVGKTTATAASAATGATVGVAVDAATGFLSLGAGAALGALLGAGVGWAAATWRKKGAGAEMMQRFTEAALLLWLEFAHALRLHAATDDQRAVWPLEIAKQVQQRRAGLIRIWTAQGDAAQRQPDADADADLDPEAVRMLAETARAVLARLYPPAQPAEIVGQPAQF